MHIHFMAVGGCGVSGLALAAKSLGYGVSGCDMKASSYTAMLEKEGVCFDIGHDTTHLENADILVHSTAVPETCPELAEAKRRGMKVFRRGLFLAELLDGRFTIGVAGSHGKTSTTWLIYRILREFGVNPNLYAGGKSGGSSFIAGDPDGPWIVELDESDGSAFHVKCNILAVTNLEHEHVDFYPTQEVMLHSFEEYILKKRPSDLIVGRGYSLSDNLFDIFGALTFPSREEIKCPKTVSNVNGMDFVIDERRWVLLHPEYEYVVGEENLPFHIIQNRSAALLSALLYLERSDLSAKPLPDNFFDTLPEVERRFQKKGFFRNAELVDDYGHHPSELDASIEMGVHSYGNFALLFQPHRYSRFNRFYEEFRNSLRKIEPVIILPVYGAGEKPEGKTSRDLYEDLKGEGMEVYYCDSVADAASFLKESLDSLRVKALVTAGAGDINTLFELLK